MLYWRYAIFMALSFIIAVFFRPLCLIGWHRWIYGAQDIEGYHYPTRMCWRWHCWKHQVWVGWQWYRAESAGPERWENPKIAEAVHAAQEEQARRARRDFERANRKTDFWFWSSMP